MDLRQLFRKVESHLSAIEQQESLTETLGRIIESLLQDFAEDFGFTGARLYVRESDGYRLESKFGEGSGAPIGFIIPHAYPPIKLLVRQGIVYMDLQSQGVDLAIEGPLGVERFSAIAVGQGNGYVVAFSLGSDRRAEEDAVLFALSSIRHAINIKLSKEKLESIILQSQEIQLSLLPMEDPKFPGWDISGRSIPAEVVGGDVFDFLPVTPKILGVAIGDATGHGLPAALQARDVVTGMRMGISEEHKMVKIFEKLNRVIHGSRLTSRFISLFYMELETDGQIIYCNAGHVPPFYYRRRKDRFYALTEGGVVLGPTANPSYQRGFFKLEPGDAVILVTDGVVEASNDAGEEFGEARVQAFVREHCGTFTAGEMVDRLLDAAREHAASGIFLDDATAVYCRRLD